MDLFKALTTLGIRDVVDIVVVAVVIYGVVRAIRRSRSGFVLTGLIMVSSLYVVARLAGLNLVIFVFQAFFTVILVALIVIFQEDLRRLFERVAVRGLMRRRGMVVPSRSAQELAAVVVKTVVDLAREKIGAIMVLEGRESVLRHVHSGIVLDAKPSDALFKSLFDPHSSGHDGAVIISGERVVQFAAHLPLSVDGDALQGRGTRHAAALGLAEHTDALCLVVSEERGTISAARSGNLVPIEDAFHLRRTVDEFLASTGPAKPKISWIELVRRDAIEKVAALIAAVLLWFFFVHEAEVVYRSFSATVDHAGLPSDLQVDSLEPRSVQVILSGPRRSFYFVEDKDVTLTILLFDAHAGTRIVTLTAPDVAFPQGLTFVNILPRELRIAISAATPPAGGEKPAGK